MSEELNPQSTPPLAGEPRQRIQSPEQVELSLPVAGPTTRILAYAIDFAMLMLLQVVVWMLLIASLIPIWMSEQIDSMAADLSSSDPEALFQSNALLMVVAIFLLIQFVLEFGYFVACEMLSGGRSIGKALLGIRVLQDGGIPIRLRDSLARNILRIADMLPQSYMVGLIAMVASTEGKRLGDLAAGTIVVRTDRPPPAPPVEIVESEALHAFRFDRTQIAKLGATERKLIRQTLRRIEQLHPRKRQEVLGRAVEVLRRTIDYEEVEAADAENFLRALEFAARRR